jgi:hypothetical protein
MCLLLSCFKQEAPTLIIITFVFLFWHFKFNRFSCLHLDVWTNGKFVAAHTQTVISVDVRKMFLTSKAVPAHAMKPCDIAQSIYNFGTWVEESCQLHALAAFPWVYVLYVFKRKLLWALRRYLQVLGEREIRYFCRETNHCFLTSLATCFISW